MITKKRVKRDIPEKLYYLQTPYKTVWCMGMPPRYGKTILNSNVYKIEVI